MKSEQYTASAALAYTFWPTVKAVAGQRRSATLEQLAELHQATERPDKKSLPLIDLAIYPGDSRAAGTMPEAWTGTVLDYDDGTPIDAVTSKLRELNLQAMVHETASSTSDKPRFHVFLPYLRPTSDELQRKRILNWLGERLPPFSRETADSKRPWFIGHLAGHVSSTLICAGFPVDALAKVKATTLGGFNREAERSKVIKDGDGVYAYFRSLAMHLANQDCDVEEELRKEDTDHFNGYAFGAHEKDILRAVRGAEKKSALPRKTPTVDSPPIDTSPAFDIESFADWKSRKPQAPEFVLAGWLPKNAVTLLAGHGGTGKSFVALNLALHLAQGKSVLGSTPKPQRILYMHCEDPRDVVHWRASRYGLGYPEELLSLDGTKTDNRLFVQTPAGFSAPTNTYALLKELCQEVDVLILDGSADVYGGNENDRGQVKAFVNLLADLAPCVLLLAHVDKLSSKAESTGHDYSGSTAWHNAVRSRWALHTLEGRVLLEVQKSNWSATGLCCELKWNDDKKVWDFGALIELSAKPDDMAPIIIRQMLALDAAGESVYANKSNRKKFTDMPPRMKPTQFDALLVSMSKSGLIEVVERKQPGGKRSADVYQVTDAGRTLVTDSSKF